MPGQAPPRSGFGALLFDDPQRPGSTTYESHPQSSTAPSPEVLNNTMHPAQTAHDSYQNPPKRRRLDKGKATVEPTTRQNTMFGPLNGAVEQPDPYLDRVAQGVYQNWTNDPRSFSNEGKMLGNYDLFEQDQADESTYGGYRVFAEMGPQTGGLETRQGRSFPEHARHHLGGADMGILGSPQFPQEPLNGEGEGIVFSPDSCSPPEEMTIYKILQSAITNRPKPSSKTRRLPDSTRAEELLEAAHNVPGVVKPLKAMPAAKMTAPETGSAQMGPFVEGGQLSDGQLRYSGPKSGQIQGFLNNLSTSNFPRTASSLAHQDPHQSTGQQPFPPIFDQTWQQSGIDQIEGGQSVYTEEQQEMEEGWWNSELNEI